MYNPNNVIIGGAIIFLVAYAFFILRRMYKRRISFLEQTNLELTNTLKQITDMEEGHMEEGHMEEGHMEEGHMEENDYIENIENISTDFFRQNNVIFGGINNPQKISRNSVEIESIHDSEMVETIPETLDMTTHSLETIPEHEENSPSHEENVSENLNTIEAVEEVETVKEVETVETVETLNTENKLGISKDDINSMTVSQLKEKLSEIGTPVVKGMKKKELRAILLAL